MSVISTLAREEAMFVFGDRPNGRFTDNPFFQKGLTPERLALLKTKKRDEQANDPARPRWLAHVRHRQDEPQEARRRRRAHRLRHRLGRRARPLLHPGLLRAPADGADARRRAHADADHPVVLAEQRGAARHRQGLRHARQGQGRRPAGARRKIRSTTSPTCARSRPSISAARNSSRERNHEIDRSSVSRGLRGARRRVALVPSAAAGRQRAAIRDRCRLAQGPARGWITGRLGGVCMDATQDNVYVVNRRDITDEEKETSISAPSIIKFNADGQRGRRPGATRPRCPARSTAASSTATRTSGSPATATAPSRNTRPDAKLLLQIGTRGKFDSVDGTRRGAGLNAARDQLHMPAGMVVDPGNGDIYVADGYGNRRVAVFDKDGKFLRQWGRQATEEETQKGAPRRVRAGRPLHRDEQCRPHLRLRPPGQPRPGVPEGRDVRAQHPDPEQVRQASRQARHRLVGRVLARPRAEVHVRDERRHRAGAHPRPRRAERSCRASAVRAIRSATSPTATRSRSIPRAASTWRKPTGAGAFRNSRSSRKARHRSARWSTPGSILQAFRGDHEARRPAREARGRDFRRSPLRANGAPPRCGRSCAA